jgi:arylsulfatase A-like enzyme
MLASYAFSAVAVLAVLIRDLNDQRPVSAWILFGGVALVCAPVWLAELIGTRRALPSGLVRLLTFLVLGVLPAGYACFHLVPIGFEGMLPLLAGALVLLVSVATAIWLWGRFGETAGHVRAVVPLIALLMLGLFLWPHVQEATLSVINPGSERERTIVFLGTWAVSLVTVCAFAIKALSRSGERVSSLLRWGAFTVCVLVGSGALEADHRLLQGHYPYFHAWLQAVGILSIEAAFALLSISLVLRWPKLTGKARLLGVISATLLLASIASFLFASFVPSAFPVLRPRMARAAIAPLLFELQPKSVLNVLPRGEDHPLLRAPLHHEARLEGGPLNILLITVDALRGDALKDAPNLTALAERSGWFQNTYTPGTRTAMALSAMTTGRYSAHLDWDLWTGTPKGMARVRNMTAAQRQQLGPKAGYTTFPDFTKFPTLAQRMRKAGLYTMAMPYLGDKSEWLGRGVGFELGFDAYAELPQMRRTSNSSTPVVRKAIEQLRQAGNKRWFQWVHLFDTHEARGSLQRYRRLVKTTDNAIADLMGELATRGDLGRTAIMITGDHGEGFGRDHPRSHATSLFEDQARVPLILHVPGLPPQRYAFPTSSLDGIATLLALVDGDLTGVDGMNLLPWLTQKRAAPERPVFTELHRYVRGPRTHDLKAVILGDYKLLFDRRTGILRLFNLKHDPRERKDLSEREPNRLRELAEVLGAFVHRGEREHPLL